MRIAACRSHTTDDHCTHALHLITMLIQADSLKRMHLLLLSHCLMRCQKQLCARLVEWPLLAVAPLLACAACSQPRATAAARASLGPDAGADGLAASLSDLRASIAQAAADQQHAQAAAAEAARLSEAAELAHAEAAAASRKARASAHKASLAAQTAAVAVAETPSPSGGAAAVQPTPGGRASAPPAATSPVSASKLDAAQPASAGSKGILPSPEVPEADQAAAAGPASEVPASDPTQVTRQDQVSPRTTPTQTEPSGCGSCSMRSPVITGLRITKTADGHFVHVGIAS